MSKINTLKGAKGQNLEYIQKNIKKWNNDILNHNFPFHLNVPNFFIIPSSVFDKYNKISNDKLFIDNEEEGDISLERILKPYITKYKKQRSGEEYNFIVRSSAVYSEDGEGLTGAGIYDSIVVKRNMQFDEDICELTYNLYGKKEEFKTSNHNYEIAFVIATYSVYRSMFSKKAIEYRKDNNILNERMNIIIQDYLDYGSDGSFYGHQQTSVDGKGIGYFNSIIKGQPDKCKIVKNGIGYIMNRNNLLKDLKLLLSKNNFEDFSNEQFIYSIEESHGEGKIFLNPLDVSNFNDTSAYFASLLFLYLEQQYGKYIQIEFVMDFNFLEKGRFGLSGKMPFHQNDYLKENMIDNQSNNILNIIQIRSLPKIFEIEKKIKFPKKEPLFIGTGIGIGKIKLKNLNKGNEERGGNFGNKKGIVVFDESEGYTILNGKQSLPKTGGVIIVYPSNFWHGHLETLIAENDNLIGVFNNGGIINDIWYSNKKVENDIKKQKDEYYNNIYKKLKDANIIEIISNGLEARVYV